MEALNDSIGLATRTLVLFYSLHQAACPSVMKEKDALPDTPERGGSELVGTGATLRDAVRKTFTHVVDKDIREEIHRLVGERGTRVRRGAAGNHLARGKRRRVAMGAAHFCKGGSSVHSGWRVGRRSGRSQHAHEVGKGLDVGDDSRIGSGSARG